MRLTMPRPRQHRAWTSCGCPARARRTRPWSTRPRWTSMSASRQLSGAGSAAGTPGSEFASCWPVVVRKQRRSGLRSSATKRHRRRPRRPCRPSRRLRMSPAPSLALAFRLAWSLRRLRAPSLVLAGEASRPRARSGRDPMFPGVSPPRRPLRWRILLLGWRSWKLWPSRAARPCRRPRADPRARVPRLPHAPTPGRWSLTLLRHRRVRRSGRGRLGHSRPLRRRVSRAIGQP